MPHLKEPWYRQERYPAWRDEIIRANGLILLPGIMGSELHDYETRNTRWVDLGIWQEADDLAFARLDPNGSVDNGGQRILARSTLSIPFAGDFYSDCLRTLGAGRFAFDWRESITLEARRLAQFLRELPADLKLRFVTHSMGGVVLLKMLTEFGDLDAAIDRIVFVAPPFWGALPPLQVIEDGTGTPADVLIQNAVLRDSAATMTGLFNLLPAPPDIWPKRVDVGPDPLLHPVRSGENLFSRDAWGNQTHADMRARILTSTVDHFRGLASSVPNVVQRLGSKMFVFVGLRGKTPQQANKRNGVWEIDAVPSEPVGKFRNGDGTVLTQSSWIASLGIQRYYAWIPNVAEDTHGSIINDASVLEGIRAALSGDLAGISVAGMTELSSVLLEIDWSGDLVQQPGTLKYGERARRRALARPSAWKAKLNPKDAVTGLRDADLFSATRAAAVRVLGGADIRAEAGRLGLSQKFLQDHVHALLLPAMYG